MSFNDAAGNGYSVNYDAFKAMHQRLYVGDTRDGSKVFYAVPCSSSVEQQLAQSQIFIFSDESYQKQGQGIPFITQKDPYLSDQNIKLLKDHAGMIEQKVELAVLDGKLDFSPPDRLKALLSTSVQGKDGVRIEFAASCAVNPDIAFVEPKQEAGQDIRDNFTVSPKVSV